MICHFLFSSPPHPPPYFVLDFYVLVFLVLILLLFLFPSLPLLPSLLNLLKM